MVLALKSKGRITLKFLTILSWTRLAKEERRDIFGLCREMLGEEAWRHHYHSDLRDLYSFVCRAH